MNPSNVDGPQDQEPDDTATAGPPGAAPQPDTDPKPARRSRRRRTLLITLAVILGVLGIGAVAVDRYIASVPVPEALTLPESTTVYYSDGKTVMATLGETNRTVIDATKLPEYVSWAVMSAEDRTFETNPGVDVKGLIRGVTGSGDGNGPGASTITMQYARAAADAGDSHSPKVAVMAWKLDDRHTKAEIMGFYLNTVYFGRNAYGIEAAAQAYFDKPAKSLTLAEAIVLAGVIKSPGDSAFDPSVHPDRARERWTYIRDGLVDPMRKLTRAEADALVFPTRVKAWSPDKPTASSGMDKPTGLVVQHVLSELRQDAAFKDKDAAYVRDGGFTIVTTIDKAAEELAVNLADGTVKGSYLHGQPETLQAALVAVEPGTGRVLAFYGGHSGAGVDYAGWYYDDNGEPTGYGAHRPGGTFAVYDLAAALKEGISVKSYWDARAVKQFHDRAPNSPVRNSSAAACQPTCTLAESTVASLTVPFYGLTEQLGAAKVIDMARAAGIEDMWGTTADGKQKRVDLRTAPGADVAPKYFGTEVGIGQYPVTVVDQANSMATFAADGVRATAHFVRSVSKDGKVVYAEKLPTADAQRILNSNAVADLSHTLKQVAAGHLADGQDSASKTGTWQYATNLADNAHAWTIGYTRKLAVAVWTGSKGTERPLRLANGAPIYGATIPGPIYRDFVVKATTAMALTPAPFTPPAFIGDAGAGNTPAPKPRG